METLSRYTVRNLWFMITASFISGTIVMSSLIH